MMYGEAMQHVAAGRAVYSATVGGTVLKIPRDNLIKFVPRVTNAGPARSIEPFNGQEVAVRMALDWELSGVVLPPPKAAA